MSEKENAGDQAFSSSDKTIARVVVRPLASALPLGFFAFAVGTVLLAAHELKWIPPSENTAFVLILLGYVAPLELLPCIFGFFSRDTGAATTMGVFSAGWIVLGTYYLLLGPEAKTTTLGIFMLMDSLAVLSLAAASMKAKPLMGVILFVSAVRFLLAAALQFGAGPPINVAAGAAGLLTGVFAVYGGLALLLEDTRQRTVLPVFRRGNAQKSIEGSLQDQLSRLSGEAGVRQQL